MSENVGAIAYDASINTGDFSKDADTVERRASQMGSTIERSGSASFRSFSADASNAFNSVGDAIGGLLKRGAVLAAAGSFGIGAAAKASWDQVSAVQQATVALNAYEKDTTKVNAALKSLVAYAQSDLGVLFNRKDLFASAQSLKIMGDNTLDLSSHVQILSRSVGLGLSNWEDLNQIVGRVGSTGRLTGDDFDNLTKAGYRLDPALRNTNITFDQLFKALDKGIPTDALAGQANTIQGLGIRLQTAFRGIGNAILGVDAETNQFVKGGLGDTLVGALKGLTDVLKDPVIKEGFANLGTQISGVASIGIPKLVEGLKWLLGNLPTVESIVAALGVAFTVAKGAAIAFAAVAEINPLVLAATAVTALVGALVYLQLKFGYVTKAIDIMKPSLSLIADSLSGITDKFKEVGDASSNVNWGTNIIVGIRNALIWLNQAIINTINGIKSFYNAFINLTPVIIFGQFISQVFIPAVKAIGAAIIQNVLPALGQLWESVTRLWNSLNPALTDALKIVGAILGGAFLVYVWAALSVINLFWQAVAIGISVIANVIDWISNLISWFGNLLGVAWNFVKAWASILWNLPQAVRDVFGLIVDYFRGMGGLILGAIGAVGGLLYSVGRDIVRGLINGIKSMIGEVLGIAGDIASGIKDKVKGVLGIHSPSTVFMELGKNVAQGFAIGIDKNSHLANNAAGRMLGGLGVPEASGVGSTASLGAIDNGISAGGGNSRSTVIEVNMSGIMSRSKSDEREIAKSLIQRVNEELVTKGVAPIGEGAI
jgi:hypothetical protein